MADRIPYISWPGVEQPLSCVYTLSQGISPGVAVLTLNPQDATKIALQGDLILGDGVGTVRLRNCKVLRVRSTLDPISGETWILEIQDRRWRWLATGFVNGTYNVPDDTRDVTRPPEGAGPYLAPARVYVPWTVRSPHQLIKQCLDAMGERNYRIDAPNVAYPLPPVNWDFENAAQALSRLCETLGCRVVYRPDTDTVWIVRIGVGNALPDPGPGTVYRDAPGIKTPSRPDSLILVGAPVKYQVEWVLEAVGEEWDGRLKPIDSLSYAPPVQVKRHLVKVTPSALADASVLTVVVEFQGSTWTAQHTMSGTTVSDATAAIAADLDGLLGVFGFTITDKTTHVEIMGPANGENFDTRVSVVGGSTLKWELVEQGRTLASRWGDQLPQAGIHLGQNETEFNGDKNIAAQTGGRLTYKEAMDRANRSVFRYYRIVNLNVETMQGPQDIPEYGKLDPEGGIRRVVLLNEQLDQTVPQASDEQVLGRDQWPITRDFYDGLFKLKPARCVGTYTREPFTQLFRKAEPNELLSGPNDEVLVDFSIVPERQLIIFAGPVYLGGDSKGTRPAEIRLRCACHLRDAVTNQLVRFTYKYDFPGPRLGTAPAIVPHHDVERLVKTTYTAYEDAGAPRGYVVTRDRVLVNDPEVAVRANYYLQAAALKYQTPLSGERQYNGIVPVYCDGAILQVTWQINLTNGAETVASLNYEHQIYVPQYPERLRLEYLRSATDAPENKPNPMKMVAPPGAAPGQGGVPGSSY